MHYKDLPYDMECAIELFTVCNYKCPYCSGPQTRKLTRRGRTRDDVKALVDFINGSDKRWLVGLSGGEPTIHPYFSEIVSALKERHFFHVFTNLSFEVDWFADIVPPEKVSFIKASLHHEAEVDGFLEKFERLVELGYNMVFVMVSAPDTFERIERAASFCEERGYQFTLSVMEGPYRDKNYPSDYTEGERSFIEKYTFEPGNVMRLHTGVSGGMDTFGVSCSAGKKSFMLDLETGDLTTCESVGRVYGNIYDGTFTPDQEYIVCPAVNGCVGYDRNPSLPESYSEFFLREGGYLRLKDVKGDGNYIDKMLETVGVDKSLSRAIVDSALDAVRDRLGGSKTLFWGAGIYGAKILAGFRKKFGDSEGAIVGFVDSLKARQDVTVLELPVYPPDDPALKEVERILITSFAFEDEIEQVAAELGLKGEIIALHKDILIPLGIEEAVF